KARALLFSAGCFARAVERAARRLLVLALDPPVSTTLGQTPASARSHACDRPRYKRRLALPVDPSGGRQTQRFATRVGGTLPALARGRRQRGVALGTPALVRRTQGRRITDGGGSAGSAANRAGLL